MKYRVSRVPVAAKKRKMHVDSIDASTRQQRTARLIIVDNVDTIEVGNRPECPIDNP